MSRWDTDERAVASWGVCRCSQDRPRSGSRACVAARSGGQWRAGGVTRAFAWHSHRKTSTSFVAFVASNLGTISISAPSTSILRTTKSSTPNEEKIQSTTSTRATSNCGAHCTRAHHARRLAARGQASRHRAREQPAGGVACVALCACAWPVCVCVPRVYTCVALFACEALCACVMAPAACGSCLRSSSRRATSAAASPPCAASPCSRLPD
jgi:hypothetical protein